MDTNTKKKLEAQRLIQKLQSNFPNKGRTYAFEEYPDENDLRLEGALVFERPWSEPELAYLEAFSLIRHQKWVQNGTLRKQANRVRLAVGLDLGEQGIYFIPSHEEDGLPKGKHAQMKQLWEDVPAVGCPGRWSPFRFTSETLVAHQTDKYNDIRAWLEFYTAHFFLPWDNLPTGALVMTQKSPRDGYREEIDTIICRAGSVVFNPHSPTPTI